MRRILRLRTLVSLERIFKKEMELFEKSGVMDGSGLKTKPILKYFRIPMSLFPFLSDNIMVDKEGTAWLTDNLPLIGVRENKKSKKEMQTKMFLYQSVDWGLCRLIDLRRIYVKAKLLLARNKEKYSTELAFE